MDLRGIANIDDSLLYVIGGIEKNQEVTDKVWKLKWVGK